MLPVLKVYKGSDSEAALQLANGFLQQCKWLKPTADDLKAANVDVSNYAMQISMLAGMSEEAADENNSLAISRCLKHAA